MKLAAIDAPPITVSEARLVDFEQCLSDALKDTQRARLGFEARLATALAAEERIEREHERAQADKLAEEMAEIARKFADEAAKVARKSERVPPLRRPLPSVRPGETVRRSWWPFRAAGGGGSRLSRSGSVFGVVVTLFVVAAVLAWIEGMRMPLIAFVLVLALLAYLVG